MQIPNCLDYLLVFIDACENLVMANDVVMPSNPPVTFVEEEELEKILFDLNVSQQSHDEELFERRVRTQVDCLAWDH
jgi:hypothetical protein